jgi:2-dehydro-3-deoxyphosphogalactonate aldolase
VLRPESVADVVAAGGQIIISPNVDEAVIRATKRANRISMPACFTPSEAFRAIDAGADALKLFPAEAASPAMLKALRAVLPPDIPIFPVGGIEPKRMRAYRAAGASGFGIGSSIYRAGRPIDDIVQRAVAFVRAWEISKP